MGDFVCSQKWIAVSLEMELALSRLSKMDAHTNVLQENMAADVLPDIAPTFTVADLNSCDDVQWDEDLPTKK